MHVDEDESKCKDSEADGMAEERKVASNEPDVMLKCVNSVNMANVDIEHIGHE